MIAAWLVVMRIEIAHWRFYHSGRQFKTRRDFARALVVLDIEIRNHCIVFRKSEAFMAHP